jgi:GNAT superfamily N-acetyltransferase
MTGLPSSPTDETAHQRVVGVLVSAFRDDPCERWLFPAEQDYLTYFPGFVMAFGGRAFAEQTVWTLADCSAVAMWLPPGVEPDGGTIVSVLEEHVAADKHGDLFAVLEQMSSAHPSYPHWYLPWFGVDAAQQGHGLGSQLLNSCLATVDSAQLPSYLESPNPRNVAFYERHGFVVTGRAQHGRCPVITLMERPARGTQLGTP